MTMGICIFALIHARNVDQHTSFLLARAQPSFGPFQLLQSLFYGIPQSFAIGSNLTRCRDNIHRHRGIRPPSLDMLMNK